MAAAAWGGDVQDGDDDDEDVPVLTLPSDGATPGERDLPGMLAHNDDDVISQDWADVGDVMRAAECEEDEEAADVEMVELGFGGGDWASPQLPLEYTEHVKRLRRQKAKQERQKTRREQQAVKATKAHSEEVARLLQQIKEDQRELARLKKREVELQKSAKDEQEKHKKELQRMQGRHEALARRAQENRRKRQMHERQNEFEIEAGGGDNLTFEDLKTTDGYFRALMLRVIKTVKFLVARYAPYAADVRFIESQFGESIAEYFTFHRWIIMTSLALSFVACIMFVLIHQLVLWNTDDLDATHEAQNHSYPPPGIYPIDWLFYSSFTRDERGYFSVSLIALSLLTLIAFAFELVYETREAAFKAYEEEYLTKTRYSRAALNLVDITAQSDEDAENLRYSARAALLTLIDADNMARKDETSAKLIGIRIAANLLQLGITVTTWVLVLVIKTNEDDIVAALAGDGRKASDNFATTLIPALLTSIVTMISPPVSIVLTLWEEWESPERVLVLQVVRIYVTQVVVIILFIVQGYQTLNKSDDDGCPPDDLGISLFGLAATKVFSVITADLGFLVAGKFLTIYVLKEQYERPEYSTAYNIMQLLYVQALIWLAVPHMPMVIVPGTLLLMLQFKFYVYLVKTHLRRPSLMWSPTDTSSWFLGLFFITFCLTQAANVYMWAKIEDFRCGPFPSESAPMLTWLAGEISDIPVVATIYLVVTSPFTLVGLAFAFAMLSSKRSSQKEALSEYLVYYQEQQKADEETHARQVTVLRAQIEVLRSTVRDMQAE